MALWCLPPLSLLGLILSSLLLLHLPSTALAAHRKSSSHPRHLTFHEAPAFRNGETCGGGSVVSSSSGDGGYSSSSSSSPSPSSSSSRSSSSATNQTIHVAMTLDSNYLRGTMAAVLSILQHSTCPENVTFHFLHTAKGSNTHHNHLLSTINTTFPFLNFNLYRFEKKRVSGKISKSIRQALDEPLNYARIYLAHMIPSSVARIIYLDSDILLVDDIVKLWRVDMGGKVVAAPEYCHANFTKYFTDSFWTDPDLPSTFDGRQPCYFNTGVMVVDLRRWREGNYTEKVEGWMGVQKRRRIYQLGSLPPFLLVFAGDIKAVDHRWNQHGLGGDNIEGKCRNLHPGPVSLLHWSGKGKPWLRLDLRKPCAVDYLWSPYDLSRSSSSKDSIEG